MSPELDELMTCVTDLFHELFHSQDEFVRIVCEPLDKAISKAIIDEDEDKLKVILDGLVRLRPCLQGGKERR